MSAGRGDGCWTRYPPGSTADNLIPALQVEPGRRSSEQRCSVRRARRGRRRRGERLPAGRDLRGRATRAATGERGAPGRRAGFRGDRQRRPHRYPADLPALPRPPRACGPHVALGSGTRLVVVPPRGQRAVELLRRPGASPLLLVPTAPEIVEWAIGACDGPATAPAGIELEDDPEAIRRLLSFIHPQRRLRASEAFQLAARARSQGVHQRVHRSAAGDVEAGIKKARKS
jgi:hypothetical protein